MRWAERTASGEGGTESVPHVSASRSGDSPANLDKSQIRVVDLSEHVSHIDELKVPAADLVQDTGV